MLISIWNIPIYLNSAYVKIAKKISPWPSLVEIVNIANWFLTVECHKKQFTENIYLFLTPNKEKFGNNYTEIFWNRPLKSDVVAEGKWNLMPKKHIQRRIQVNQEAQESLIVVLRHKSN